MKITDAKKLVESTHDALTKEKFHHLCLIVYPKTGDNKSSSMHVARGGSDLEMAKLFTILFTTAPEYIEIVTQAVLLSKMYSEIDDSDTDTDTEAI